MARLKASESDYKKSQAKDLFVKGFTIANISEIIGIGQKSIAKWRDDNQWEEQKEMSCLKPSTIRGLTLKMALAIEKGEKLPYRADDISKVVAAFERITDKKKIAVYTMESIDGFSSFMLEKAAQNTGKKRDLYLDKIKEVRPFFDEYINQLLQDD